MSPLRHSLPAVLLALGACAPDAVRLRPAHEPPAALTARFDLRVALTLEQVELEQDGRSRVDPDAAGSRLESSERLVFEDRRQDGALVRRFAVLEGEKRHVRTDEFGEHVDERVKSSPLRGCSVRLAAGQPARFVAGEADERLLAGLVEDSALSVFLTDAPLEPNQRWRVPAAALGELLHPGGDLELAAAEDSAAARASGAQLRANLAGEVEVIYWGLRELGGLELGVLQLVGEVSTHAQTRDEELELVREQRYKLVRRVDGEILWDRRAGRAHTARLECQVTLRSIQRQTSRDESAPRVFESRATYRGRSRTDARFEELR